MTSEIEHLDADVAKNLITAAKEALEKPPSSGTDDAPFEDSSASEIIQNVAHTVLDKSNQAAKACIANVVHEIQDNAQSVASGTAGSTSSQASNVQETLSMAVYTGAYVGSTTDAAGQGDASSGSDCASLLTTIATWCSFLCDPMNDAADGEPQSMYLRAAAENVTEAWQYSSTIATSSPIETPPPPFFWHSI